MASRRACEDLIVRGQVKVNGKVVTELGSRINPDKDTVTVKGLKVVAVEGNTIFIKGAVPGRRDSIVRIVSAQ